jgi:hypothetical protein
MLQSIVVVIILVGLLVYMIRHYAKILRADTPACSGCSGSCAAKAETHCREMPGGEVHASSRLSPPGEIARTGDAEVLLRKRRKW